MNTVGRPEKNAADGEAAGVRYDRNSLFENRTSPRGALFLIDEYRAHISPRIRGSVVCRFEPTCSAYGREAIAKYGFGKGSAKTLWRIARCGPWTSPGTVDRP